MVARSHFSAGQPGVNLAYGVANPPQGGLGQTYVTKMPVPKLPITRLYPGSVPGESSSGVPGIPVQNASGNPDVATVQKHVVVEPLGYPRVLGVGQESSWRGGANFANDKLMTMDRHGIMKRGNELSGRLSGNTDPPMDGPARPSLKLINRTLNYQQGTDATRATDDLSRGYSRNETGMYLGTQGDPWNQVYGGTPGLYQPYGTYQGIGNVPVQGIQSPVEPGMPGDGPQSFKPGPPHGLHSQTMPAYSQTLGYYMAVPQMRAPRIDRPLNSKIGGQSFSQFVQPQGQAGTIAMKPLGSSAEFQSSGRAWAKKPTGQWRGVNRNGQ